MAFPFFSSLSCAGVPPPRVVSLIGDIRNTMRDSWFRSRPRLRGEVVLCGRPQRLRSGVCCNTNRPISDALRRCVFRMR